MLLDSTNSVILEISCPIGRIAVRCQSVSYPHSRTAGHYNEATATNEHNSKKDPQQRGDNKRKLVGLLVAESRSWCEAGMMYRINPHGTYKWQTKIKLGMKQPNKPNLKDPELFTLSEDVLHEKLWK